MNPKKTLRKYVSFIVVGAVFIQTHLYGGIEKELDPAKVAEVEVGAWKAYYSKNKLALIRSITNLLGQQYQIHDAAAWSSIIPKLGVAMYRFSNMPVNTTHDEYIKEILPTLTEAYQSLKEKVGANWDPKKVATYDLEWWIMRRTPEKHQPEIVGQKIAQLYRAVYGEHDSFHFSRAGYLKATAARYRDLCKLRWHKVSEADWKVIETILTLSYEELTLGIEANENQIQATQSSQEANP